MKQTINKSELFPRGYEFKEFAYLTQEERERERLRQMERKLREEERRRQRDQLRERQRQREVHRKQRDEAIKLARERERLRYKLHSSLIWPSVKLVILGDLKKLL